MRFPSTRNIAARNAWQTSAESLAAVVVPRKTADAIWQHFHATETVK